MLVRARRSIKNGAVNSASAVLGATHFIGYSIAEVALATECALKLKADGIDPSDTRAIRVYSTLAKQQVIINGAMVAADSVMAIRRKAKGITDQVVESVSTAATATATKAKSLVTKKQPEGPVNQVSAQALELIK